MANGNGATNGNTASKFGSFFTPQFFVWIIAVLVAAGGVLTQVRANTQAITQMAEAIKLLDQRQREFGEWRAEHVGVTTAEKRMTSAEIEAAVRRVIREEREAERARRSN